MKSWRRSRPFWGGLFILVAGMELLSIPLAVNALSVAIRFGTVGATYLIALIMMIAGLLVWLQPGQRVFLGLVAVLLSMASFVYSNLGGFLVGMTLGLLGGMLAIAWTPVSRPDTRVDTLDVRIVIAAARTIRSRMSALIRAVGHGARPRRSASVRFTFPAWRRGLRGRSDRRGVAGWRRRGRDWLVFAPGRARVHGPARAGSRALADRE
ncbi:hypothetical protein FHU36_000030 [Nonomuraea muscovyensis]|uniref:Uncharacterized protein n=1 Tax=Nonomuraea muscovyensis TaxID=1124761 RepID=A0A7X0EWD6_9ACTN|nr:DUF6114 domain-containing protein [Nonomuraea muscovyensis]MBB6343521.1 hypothetical protein [Nonomuraea muscovyensis]